MDNIFLSLSGSFFYSSSGNSSKQGGNRYSRYEIAWIDMDILEELVEVMSRKTFEILGWRGSNFVFGICKMEDVFHRSFYLDMEEEQLQIVESLAIRGVHSITYIHGFLTVCNRVWQEKVVQMKFICIKCIRKENKDNNNLFFFIN